MLLTHLDNEAQKKIIGVETEYTAAMEKIDKYFGDPRKVIQACRSEIKLHPQIYPFDYKSMITYKDCLVNNYARLRARKLDHEMSNTASMEFILKKFPIQENVEWNKHLAKTDALIQEKPFPEFMNWLDEVGASWEFLASSGTGSKPKSDGRGAYFGDYQGEPSGERDNSCFGCGESGHYRRACPNPKQSE